MPADFRIDEQRALVYSRGLGNFTYDEFLDHMSRLIADPRFRPEFNQVVDCRSITAMVFTAEQVKDLAGRSVFSARSRRAFVVSADLPFGLARMFASYREMGGAAGIMIFRGMPTALSWLNLPPDYDPFAEIDSNPGGQRTPT